MAYISVPIFKLYIIQIVIQLNVVLDLDLILFQRFVGILAHKELIYFILRNFLVIIYRRLI